jgi:membrane-associated protease RseP (regulator of RpoE activity)
LGHAEIGISPKVPPIVERVLRDYPAREAGIEPGAEIVALDGELVDDASVIPKTIAYHYKPAPAGSEEEVVAIPMEVTWRNPGEEELRTATLTPVITKSVIDSQIRIQLAKRFYYATRITFAEPKRRLGLVASFGEAIKQTNRAWEETIRILKGLFTGQVNHQLIGGPVAIFQLSAQVGRRFSAPLLVRAFLQGTWRY